MQLLLASCNKGQKKQDDADRCYKRDWLASDINKQESFSKLKGMETLLLKRHYLLERSISSFAQALKEKAGTLNSKSEIPCWVKKC
jgi:hypothetical protein